MKVLMLVLLMLVTLSDISATTTHSQGCDVDCIGVVKRLLQESELGISTGYGEKQSYRLGDKVAVALLKIYGNKDIAKSKNISVFLPIIRAAFLHPDLISDPEDRRPTVTMRFLRDLERKIGDSVLKRDISSSIDWLSKNMKHTSLK